MRTIAVGALFLILTLILTGCVQNSYERPYMISHEKVDENLQEIPQEEIIP